jgi:hypothetical protein
MSVPWIWSGILVATFILMAAMAPYISLLPDLVRDEYGRGVGSYGVLFQPDVRRHGGRVADVCPLATPTPSRAAVLRRVRDQ